MEKLEINYLGHEPELQEGMVAPRDFIKLANAINALIDENQKLRGAVKQLAQWMEDPNHSDYKIYDIIDDFLNDNQILGE